MVNSSIPYMDKVRYLFSSTLMFYWPFDTRFDCQPFEMLQANADIVSVFEIIGILFYMTTVAIHFPSPCLTHETLT
jgi:hypothetical protein